MESKDIESTQEPEKREVRKAPPSPEELQKEFADLVKKKFGGHVEVRTMGPSVGPGPNPEAIGSEDEALRQERHQNILEFAKKPKDIKDHLDRFVIGQGDAKKALAIAVCDHYNHLKALEADPLRFYQKQNVMILGPTGVGKTFLVKKIADFIGVPFVKADATRFSEVGYMGANVDDVIRDLVQKADGDISLAEKGIVYIDEVDKIAGQAQSGQKDVSGKGVQFSFLRLLEDSQVDLNSSHDMASQFKTMMSFQKSGKVTKEVVSTKNILFIFSGAFHGLEKIVHNRLQEKTIGVQSSQEKVDEDTLLQSVSAEDLVKFGFEHEFVGRLPVRVACHKLNSEMLLEILEKSEQSIVEQYRNTFGNYGIQVRFSKEALEIISRRAEKQKTGARALNAVFEEALRPFKYELPSSSVKEFEVHKELLKNPEGYLHHLLGGG